jgi:pimeloyl-ACP methyl ester carboxylesterase
VVGFGIGRKSRFFYKAVGLKPVVVLIHGLNESAVMWQGWKCHEGFRNSICPDFPGFGGNQVGPDFDFSMAGYAQWLHSYLSDKKGPFLLVGHSMGGYVALAYLHRYPLKVAGIVLVNSYASADTEHRRQNREQAIAMLGKNPAAYFRLFVESLFQPEPYWQKRPEGRLLQRQMKGLNPTIIQRVLHGLKERQCHKATVAEWKSKVHYVYGSADSMLESSILEKEILEVGAHSLCIAGKGHMLPWQAQEAVQGYISKQFNL